MVQEDGLEFDAVDLAKSIEVRVILTGLPKLRFRLWLVFLLLRLINLIAPFEFVFSEEEVDGGD